MLRKFCFLVFLVLACPCLARAGIVVLPADQDMVELSGSLEALRDEGGRMTIAEAVGNPAFHPLPGFLREGFDPAVYWLRFTVAGDGRPWWLEFTPPYVDDIQVFQPDPERPGTYAVQHVGDRRPQSAQEIRHHRPIVRLAPPGTAAATLYVRVSTTSSMLLGLRLIRDGALVERTGAELMTVGVVYGMSAAVFLTALLFGLWMRNRQALLYAAYVLPGAVSQFLYEGLGPRFLYPDWPVFADRAINVSICLTIAINALLFRSLLETPTHLPPVARTYRGFAVLAAVAAVVAAAGYWQGLNLWVNLLAGAMLLLNLTVTAIMVRHGVPWARYFLVGFSVYSVLLMAALARNLGLLDPVFSQFWLARAAALLPALIIGAGIARRLHRNELQHRHAQAAALVAAQEAEALLEARVAERTTELQVMLDRIQAQERTLREAKDQAEAANRAKSAFLAMMSHELRTPMSGVLSVADLLRATDLTPHQHSLVKTIGESGHSLLAILNDILDLSKLETGRLEIERHRFDLPKLVHGVTDLLRAKATEKAIALDVTLSPDLPAYVDGDPTRIRQFLLNLVGNAVKFTDRGGVTLTVRVLARSDRDATLEFTVTDTGIGMSEQTIAALFTPFQQADASISRRFGGTGLGLAICQRLVTAMGGTVAVRSAEGQGSTFTVILPCRVAALPSQPASVATPPNMAPLRVLLAEDNALNQKIIPLILERQGHAVDLASDGAAAIRALAEHPVGHYDLILMDMQMPQMDGLEAARAIRAMPTGHAATPIIALTANAFDSDRERCLAAGMNGYLSKPLIPAALNAELHRVLAAAVDAATPQPV